MRIVFFGTPALALPTLDAVHDAHEVVAVVCQPDRPQGRSRKPVACPVKVQGEKLGLLVHQPRKLNDGAFEEWLKLQRPDVCVLAAYGRILKQPIIDVPARGFLNVHPSLLPKLRGPSPIQSAIIGGETVTGVTIMRLSLEMDAGDILLQREEAIAIDDTAVSLTDRLAVIGAELMIEALKLVESGKAAFTIQEHNEATYCEILRKEHGRICWGKPALDIHNLVRGCNPWPAGQTLLNGAVCKIVETVVVGEDSTAAPGTVTAVEKDRVVVATGKGQVGITVFQAPGKRAMPMADYLRGHGMAAGDRFEEIAAP